MKLTVRDSGKGISPKLLPRIFEPFFSTKPPTAGSGLGLSMVMGFMKQSGGAVHVNAKLGEGATFDLCFNALDRLAEPETPRMQNAGPSVRSKARILLVEDEPDVPAVWLILPLIYPHRPVAAALSARRKNGAT